MPEMKSQTLYFTSLYLVAHLSLFLSSVKAQGGCQFPNLNRGATPAKQLQPIQSLIGKRYSATDDEGKFIYDIGICVEGPEPSEAPQYKDVAVLQTEKQADGKVVKIAIGKYTNTKEEKIRIVEEFNNSSVSTDCYYLFEMQSCVTCQKAALITVSLSFGSIIIIVTTHNNTYCPNA
ncbi:hypothetical protein KUTeg_001578 [Tegillarca granosa]|uniref:Uncharacterized protein n=1 Tax=Tegillarca granosa TaxID=220873 RepID=A0ABQ9FV17_TEGGR|nr:hypothetical protein KUTeg_001578 [Tegillarca granosa]